MVQNIFENYLKKKKNKKKEKKTRNEDKKKNKSTVSEGERVCSFG